MILFYTHGYPCIVIIILFYSQTFPIVRDSKVVYL